MALKLKCFILSAIYLLCIQINDTDAICHLEQMKQFALNSCELLIDALGGDFSNPHSERLKREILESRNSTNSHYDESRHIRPVHLRIKSRDFPVGGYIVLDHLYAKILRQTYPSKYHAIPKTLYHHHADGTGRTHHTVSDGNRMSNDVPYRRRKRNHDDKQDDKKIANFTYCCMHQCHQYDMCEL